MDATAYIRFLLALVLVLGLIWAFAWIMKRLGLAGGAQGPLTRRRRLRTVESAMVDGRHRVVLLRRDDVEHLVLIGPNTSQVIESGIPAPVGEPPPESVPLAKSFRALLTKDPQP
jgi:flagellar protein FliO/FliZ